MIKMINKIKEGIYKHLSDFKGNPNKQPNERRETM
jgi:hypothetical protein